MKRKVLKLLSIVLSGTIFLGTISPVSAYDLDENGNSLESIEYQNTEDEDFTDIADVFAEISSQYKVTIPKTVVLSGESKDARYFVKVEGDIAGYEQISVVPDNEFLLYAKNKDAQKASVSQDKTNWRYNDFSTNGNGYITSPGITAGKWQGTFNFNLDLVKVLGDIITLPVDNVEDISLDFQYGDFKILDKKEGYTYISSNPDILEIDEDGKIIAKSSGTTSIIVTDENGTTKEIMVNIKPTDNVEISVEDMENNEIRLEEGMTKIVNLKSNNTLNLSNPRFISSNEDIVKVDENGNVIAVSKGIATITIYSDNSLPKTFTVTVDKPGEVSMSMNSKKMETLKLSGASKTLNFDTNEKLIYESSDSEIVSVDENGNITAKNVGTTFITVKDTNGKTKEIKVTVKPSDNIVASIDGVENNNVKLTATESKKFNITSSDTLVLKNVSYTSENQNIVKIDNDGNIEAVGEGTTKIIIKSDNSIDKVIPVTVGHKEGSVIKENEVLPTCTKEGTYDDVVYCTFCGDEVSRVPKTIPALGHKAKSAVKENEILATCTKDGSYDEVVYCSVCNAEISRTVVKIPALGHKAKSVVKENEVSTTCTSNGSYDDVVYCSVCNAEISRTKKTITALGHNYVEGTCTRCGNVLPALTYSASNYSGSYDAKAHSISVTSSGNTIQYSTDNKTWSATNPAYTNAGTYTVYYKISKNGYKTITGSRTVSISACNGTWTCFSVAQPTLSSFNNAHTGFYSINEAWSTPVTVNVNGKATTVKHQLHASFHCYCCGYCEADRYASYSLRCNRCGQTISTTNYGLIGTTCGRTQ